MSIRLLFVGSSIDVEDPVTANAVQMIEAFANDSNIESIKVLGLRIGRHDLPARIPVKSLEHPTSPSLLAKFRALIKFYLIVLRMVGGGGANVIYCYMTPTYPLLLYPIRLLLRKRVCLWYAHTAAGLLTKLSVSHCVDRWFASTKALAPLERPNLRIVGQGVNHTLFQPTSSDKEYDFITVGRIDPVKRLELIVEGLGRCREIIGREPSLLVCGEPTDTGSESYERRLVALVGDLKLDNNVEFAGKVDYADLPGLYNRSRCFVFAQPGGLGKVLMEAMSCALPAVVAEPHLDEFFSAELAGRVLCHADADAIGEAMAAMIELPAEDRLKIGRALRRMVEEEHNLTALVDRIVAEIEEIIA